MSTGFETQPSFDYSKQAEPSSISPELMVYVLECMPSAGCIVPIEQIAEDLDETPDMILAVMEELKTDRLLNYTHDNKVIPISDKDKEFLESLQFFNSL